MESAGSRLSQVRALENSSVLMLDSLQRLELATAGEQTDWLEELLDSEGNGYLARSGGRIERSD